jgi:hypothetical protein
MDVPSQGDTTSFLASTARKPQIHHSEKMSLTWNHPTKGEITEVLCEPHYEEVLFSLKKLGMGYTGSKANGICLRCIYVGFDIKTWIGK